MFSDSDHVGLMPIELPSSGYLGDYLRSFPAVGASPSTPVGRALGISSGSSRDFPTDSSCSLGAVHPYEHHSDSSQARFDGGAWLVGYVGSPSPSAAREDHLDSRGFEIYDCGERFAGEADLSDLPPAAAAESQVASDDEDLFSSESGAGPE